MRLGLGACLYSKLGVFFFFQAEDGIRDRNVTGVQTCALPISIGLLCIRRSLAEGRIVGFATGLGAATADATYGAIAAFGLTAISSFLVAQKLRSEERRVGKECRSGWARDQ